MNVGPLRSAPLLLALAGCGFVGNVHFDGVSVSDDAGVVSVDGVTLPHARWLALDVPADVTGLELASATREIRVSTAAPGEAARLEGQVFSEVEGEGALALLEGRLVATPTGAGRVLLNGVRGSVPAGIRLQTRCGVALTSVQAPHGLAGLQARCGTGALELGGGPLGAVGLENGTGATTLSGVRATSVEGKSGTGAWRATDLACDELSVKSGTGSVDLAGVQCQRLRLETGTGDVKLDRCRSTSAFIESGTGDVTQSGDTDLGQADFDLGTGHLRQEPRS